MRGGMMSEKKYSTLDRGKPHQVLYQLESGWNARDCRCQYMVVGDSGHFNFLPFIVTCD